MEVDDVVEDGTPRTAYTSAEELAGAALEKVHYSCLAAKHVVGNVETAVAELSHALSSLPQPPDQHQVFASGLRDRIEQIEDALSHLQPKLESEVGRLRARITNISKMEGSEQQDFA
jgi:hypothetical protein